MNCAKVLLYVVFFISSLVMLSVSGASEEDESTRNHSENMFDKFRTEYDRENITELQVNIALQLARSDEILSRVLSEIALISAYNTGIREDFRELPNLKNVTGKDFEWITAMGFVYFAAIVDTTTEVLNYSFPLLKDVDEKRVYNLLESDIPHVLSKEQSIFAPLRQFLEKKIEIEEHEATTLCHFFLIEGCIIPNSEQRDLAKLSTDILKINLEAIRNFVKSVDAFVCSLKRRATALKIIAEKMLEDLKQLEGIITRASTIKQNFQSTYINKQEINVQDMINSFYGPVSLEINAIGDKSVELKRKSSFYREQLRPENFEKVEVACTILS